MVFGRKHQKADALAALEQGKSLTGHMNGMEAQDRALYMMR